ncbi:rab-like protein 6 isoform X2 [Tachysurus fulvidraco]|uniref:rab-like protein 6 isoform X2 n=1 Tax=Tachysurus fulvidraco TaxID=1234273 RepID=UPI000F5126AF|nr:rab-like protein 6 isoform X2 [Tachysurus fulvidraco]
MFSALKKLVGSEAPVQQREKNIPAGLQSMNQSLQRRFAKGVQYNMKIVIRGDRNTGKSTLWQRLQGGKFQEEYIPTQEIQVTSIHWNYKTTDDVVKVEVWDVVDKGRGKKRADTLKLENDPQEAENEMALDAEFLDVYKNCNGVIMMFDITKQWTYNYILRELPRVPTHVPVCVLGNHRDMGEHRVILPDDIRDFINSLNRMEETREPGRTHADRNGAQDRIRDTDAVVTPEPLGSSYIHYAESSMKNGFGLKYLHRFFNIPFLQLQRETLLRQLETNQLDIDATLEELTVQQETEDQNYEIFLEMMEARAKGHRSPTDANGQSPSSGSQSPVVPAGASSTGSSSPGTPQQPPVIGQNPQLPSTSPPVDAQIPVSLPPAFVPSPSPAQQLQKRSFISRLFGSTAAPETPTSVLETEPAASRTPVTVQCVDDFVPDEGLDKSFLEDSVASSAKHGMNIQPQPTAMDSDSDGEGRGGNPMVAGFQDDLDPDDAAPMQQPRSSVPSNDLNITLSSDDEETAAKPVVSKDEDLDIQLESHLDDFSSLVLEEKPNPVKSLPSVQPPMITEPSILTPTPVHVSHNPHTHSPSKRGKAKGPLSQGGESSDTDPEAPVAQQMLSFVMDDPDFESEEDLVQKDKKDGVRIRSDLPDLSDDELVPTEPLKSTGLSFKHKNESDLFGLGFEEKSVKSKESSDEQDEKESKHSTKEKKKKKKKSKEDEEKSMKKKKHKKKEREEPEGAGDEKEKKKKKSRSRKAGDLDDLEAFLAGGAASEKREEGDYEEL